MENKQYDFTGWATRNDLRCSDGRIIRKDAFKHCDGQTVPLCWGHRHDDPQRVLGHALLKNHEEGVRCYGVFNDTEQGQVAKQLVEHGDVVSLSIYANQLKQNGSDVIHGAIREVSLVLAGANPGAFIDNFIRHGENFVESEDEGIIYADQDIELYHAEEPKSEEKKTEEKPMEEKKTEKSEKSLKEAWEAMTKKLTEDEVNLIYGTG